MQEYLAMSCNESDAMFRSGHGPEMDIAFPLHQRRAINRHLILSRTQCIDRHASIKSS